MFDVWIGCALMVDTGGPVRKQHTLGLGLDSSSRPFIFLCRKMKDYFFLQGNLNAQSESFMSRQVRAWRCSQRTSLIYSLSHNSKWVIATMYWDNGFVCFCVSCSPPVRWGLLDFMSAVPPASRLLLLRRNSTESSWSQWSPPDLNHKESPKIYQIECQKGMSKFMPAE